MLKENKKKIIITGVVILLPILAGLLLWKQLPEQMATHFDSKGVANGWSSKAFAVFGLPVIILGCQVLCVFCTLNDPRRARIGGKMFRIILWICPVVSLVCGAAIYGSALGYQVNMAYMGNVLMGVIFLVIGNYLPKCRQNYTVGIKLPWTLHDEDNWNKTHRVGGWCFMAAGVVMFFNVFLKASWLTFAVILLAALIPAIYSFLLYRKSTGGEL